MKLSLTYIVVISCILFLFGGLLAYLWFRLKLKNKSMEWKSRLDEAGHRLQTIQELRETDKTQIEKLEHRQEKLIHEHNKEYEHLRQEKEFLGNELTRKSTEYTALLQRHKEQKEELERLEMRFQKEFENLAHKILETNSEKFTRLNKTNIENILTPLQERIKGFEENVQKNREDALKRHSELGKQLELLNHQNLKISEEANNLTKALKGDSKMQGNWGEMILERVLEQSGLKKDREYFTQKSFKAEGNKRLQPDIIIALPGDKKMIVDAKVSLKAYENYVNTQDETKRQPLLDQHLFSLKRHIKDLSQKKYEQIYSMESPDFVLLFIPIEAAFALASQAHPGLYTDAFEKNIILVTPTTLLAVLRTIENMWQHEKQKENTLKIATQAGRLYDAFVNLIDELEKIGRQIDTVQNSYDRAMVKLKGRNNLISRVEKLRKLGAKTSKQIPPKFITNPKEIEP